MVSRSNNIGDCFQSSKVCREFIKVRSLEAVVRNTYKTGGKPSPEIIIALEQAQGRLLGRLSDEIDEKSELHIGQILISVNRICQE